jgi:hypothetical protein
MAFLRNAKPGPASAQGAAGMGLERPYDVKFGPDGAMDIVDYGVARINPSSPGTPYEFPPKTGIIWKVSRSGPRAAPIPLRRRALPCTGELGPPRAAC